MHARDHCQIGDVRLGEMTEPRAAVEQRHEKRFDEDPDRERDADAGRAEVEDHRQQCREDDRGHRPRERRGDDPARPVCGDEVPVEQPADGDEHRREREPLQHVERGVPRRLRHAERVAEQPGPHDEQEQAADDADADRVQRHRGAPIVLVASRRRRERERPRVDRDNDPERERHPREDGAAGVGGERDQQQRRELERQDQAADADRQPLASDVVRAPSDRAGAPNGRTKRQVKAVASAPAQRIREGCERPALPLAQFRGDRLLQSVALVGTAEIEDPRLLPKPAGQVGGQQVDEDRPEDEHSDRGPIVQTDTAYVTVTPAPRRAHRTRASPCSECRKRDHSRHSAWPTPNAHYRRVGLA